MRYKNAPIKEAVFDIRIAAIALPPDSIFDVIHEIIKKDFPNKKKIMSGAVLVQLNQVTAEATQEVKNPQLSGLMFSNENNTLHAQFRNDGFTLNVVGNYKTWEEHSSMFFDLYAIYNKYLAPVSVFRLAVRYVNSILIPYPIEHLSDFIKNTPTVPNFLPQTLNHFIQQIQVPTNDLAYNIIVTTTIEKVQQNKLPFLLDIDVSKNKGIKNEMPEIIKHFESMRKIKNDVFEAYVTDETRKLFS